MSDRIVPEPATLDNASITGLDQLHAHLDELLADASKPFDAKIFDDVELQLTGTLYLTPPSNPPGLTQLTTPPPRGQHPRPAADAAPPAHHHPQVDDAGPDTLPDADHQTPGAPLPRALPLHRRPPRPQGRPGLPAPGRQPARPRHPAQGRRVPRRGRHPQHHPRRIRGPGALLARRPRRRRR